MESFEKSWYVLHTYSGYENRVKANIESRAQSMRMGDYIFRVVVPEETATEIRHIMTAVINVFVYRVRLLFFLMRLVS